MSQFEVKKASSDTAQDLTELPGLSDLSADTGFEALGSAGETIKNFRGEIARDRERDENAGFLDSGTSGAAAAPLNSARLIEEQRRALLDLNPSPAPTRKGWRRRMLENSPLSSLMQSLSEPELELLEKILDSEGGSGLAVSPANVAALLKKISTLTGQDTSLDLLIRKAKGEEARQGFTLMKVLKEKVEGAAVTEMAAPVLHDGEHPDTMAALRSLTSKLTLLERRFAIERIIGLHERILIYEKLPSRLGLPFSSSVRARIVGDLAQLRAELQLTVSRIDREFPMDSMLSHSDRRQAQRNARGAVRDFFDNLYDELARDNERDENAGFQESLGTVKVQGSKSESRNMEQELLRGMSIVALRRRRRNGYLHLPRIGNLDELLYPEEIEAANELIESIYGEQFANLQESQDALRNLATQIAKASKGEVPRQLHSSSNVEDFKTLAALAARRRAELLGERISRAIEYPSGPIVEVLGRLASSSHENDSGL